MLRPQPRPGRLALRAQLEHVLRAVSAIVDDPDLLVIGSRSILGAIPEHLLPPVVTRSAEVDIAFFDDPDGRKADLVERHRGRCQVVSDGVALTMPAPPPASPPPQ